MLATMCFLRFPVFVKGFSYFHSCYFCFCRADSVECADLCALSVSLAQSQQRILASYAAPPPSAAVAASSPTSLEARLFESDTRMVAALQRQMHAVHAMLRSSSSATA